MDVRGDGAEETLNVATVAHELRTPLASMIGYLELLRDGGGLDDGQLRLIDVVERNSVRLLGVVEGLLNDPNRVERTRRMQRDPLAVDELVARVVEVMRPLADRAAVDLVVDLDPAPAVATVVGDRQLLERVFVNLVSNAIKFTPSGGLVGISSFPAGSGALTIEVTDTGVGIAPDEQRNLFERFYRTRHAEGADVPGSGLGLSICRDLVADHDGAIELRSSPGVGTSVAVTLPVAGPGAPSSAADLRAARRSRTTSSSASPDPRPVPPITPIGDLR